MKSTLLSEVGVIGPDGKLRLPMERVNMFCGEHAGERVIVKFEALERHSSAALFGYYFGYILPTLRQALYKIGTRATEKEIHEAFWSCYPGEHNPEEDIRQAPKSQVSDYIDWLKMVAADGLDIYIEDSKVI